MKVKLIIISLFVAVLGLGGVAQAEGGYGYDKNKVHGHDALLVSIGASTTVGYTFDSSLLDLSLGSFLAENHHIPLFAQYLISYFGVHDVIEYNFAVPGKTSEEVLNEQVPQVLKILPENRLHKVVFTIEGGGNDLRHFQVDYIEECTSSEPADQNTCLVNLNSVLDEIESNLWEITAQLKDASPDAIIILQTQFNSLYGVLPNGDACADDVLLQVADLAFEGNTDYGHPINGLNVRIREIAADLDVSVGDVAGYLYTAPGNLYQNPAFFGGDCTHLAGTWDGIPTYGIAGDEYGMGYEAILGSFIHALPVQ